MNRLDEYPEIELTNEIERSGKVGMYIILFCFVALALIGAGYFVSKPVTDNTTPVAGIDVGTDTDNSLSAEAQIKFSDAQDESAEAEIVAQEGASNEVAAVESEGAAEVVSEEIAAAESEQTVVDAPVQLESTDSDTNALQDLAIEDVFDSGLIFVSASEPKYLITGDERRLDLGDEVDEGTLLAGITNENVILERQGNFIVIDLPDPSAE